MSDQLREFRKGVSVLKKQGLIPARIGRKKIDARSVLPNFKVKGKRLDTLVRKYDDVVSGKATAISVPKKDLAKYRKTGFETAAGKVIVPHSATEKVSKVGPDITITSKSGMQRVILPIEFHTLPQYFRDIERNADLINRMKRNNEYWGIRFYGGQRAHFYADIRSLIADFQKYDAVDKKMSMSKQQEIYKHLEIMRISTSGAKRLEAELGQGIKTRSLKYQREQAKKFRKKLKRKPQAKQNEYRAAAAARMREYRARLKRNKKAHAAYKAKAKKRAKKSRKKNK